MQHRLPKERARALRRGGLRCAVVLWFFLAFGLLWIDRSNFLMCKADPGFWDADAELGRIVREGAIREAVCGDRGHRGMTRAGERAARAARNCGYAPDDARRTIEFAGAERAAHAGRCPDGRAPPPSGSPAPPRSRPAAA